MQLLIFSLEIVFKCNPSHITHINRNMYILLETKKISLKQVIILYLKISLSLGIIHSCKTNL